MKRDVGVALNVDIHEPTECEFQITVAPLPGLNISEELNFAHNGDPLTPSVIEGSAQTRIHVLTLPPGNLVVNYTAHITGRAEPFRVSPEQRSLYLRPSRYAEVDKFFGFAAAEFGSLTDDAEKVLAVTEWVRGRLAYIPGASDHTDGATDTLLAGAGVCRDYAHLVVALLRALAVPARVAAVFAPGCVPMDFHAVAEAVVGDRWVVVDATGLAPRESMLRIATGRDAADIAFLDNHGGSITLWNTWITAVVGDGRNEDLPIDDRTELISLG